jgi:glutamate racemase
VSKAENPIGVFDSGVGGLSVLREIRRLLPQEQLLYVADSAHAPYGDKPKEFIHERAGVIFDFFLARDAKAIVVACNTATGAAVRELRERHVVPIIAMEPAVKPAVERTQSGVVGVLATSRTLASHNFHLLHNRFSGQAEIIPMACPGLVERVEAGDLDSDKTRALVAGYVQPLIQAGADTIVLGCTHYPFLASLVREIVGDAIAVIDSGPAIAKELNTRLERFGIKNQTSPVGTTTFFSSANSAKVRGVIGTLWGEDVEVGLLSQ